MTHNETRAHWIVEGLIGTGTGILFGVTVVATAHVSLRNVLYFTKKCCRFFLFNLYLAF